MLSIKRSTRFKKDFKNIIKQPFYDEDLFKYVIYELACERPLDEKFFDHALQGKHADVVGCRECHIKPDWLLVYKVYKDDLILYLIETRSHSNAF